MVKFMAGFLLGVISLCGFAAYGDTVAVPIVDTFMRAGGYGSDNNAHALKVEADGSVHCSDLYGK